MGERSHQPRGLRSSAGQDGIGGCSVEEAQINLGYTKILAPFDGIIIERVVKFADNVTPNQKLFRISDFDPLLCPIRIPEKSSPV